MHKNPNNKKCRYLCIEGGEGSGKTTQALLLAEYLASKGYSVLSTKEPGTAHLPLTMQLRGIMLDAQYESQLTRQARELISQAIRSIHVEKLVEPSLTQYDFIVQDRGILSGLSYGVACGNRYDQIINLNEYINEGRPIESSYDDVIILTGNVSLGLSRALASKQEFSAGDAIETRGVEFLQHVENNMKNFSSIFTRCHNIDVTGKTVQAVFSDILAALEIKNGY